jgi:uncharacterized protein (TIGR03437 family)
MHLKLIALVIVAAILFIVAVVVLPPTQIQSQSIALPGVTFSTLFGGSQEDTVRDVAVDSQGYVYVAGGTASPDFPTTAGAFSRTLNPGTSNRSFGSARPMDVFVAKFTPDGELVWSTLLGGPNYDRAYAIEVDAQGFVYVGGRAGEGYPTTSGAVQTQFGGDDRPNPLYGKQDAFATKISPDGSQLVWSTYFGGPGLEIARDLALDSSGNVYLGLASVGGDLPHISPGSFQTTRKGVDGGVAKISSDGRRVLYATYLGGSGEDGETPSIRIDSSGSAYVLMGVGSSDAPVTPGAFSTSYNGGNRDMLLSKLSPDGSSLVYSTFIGGSGYEGTETHGLALDTEGNAYIAVLTGSPNMPVTPNAFQKTYVGGGPPYPWDGYVAKISKDGSTLLAGTYIGGKGREDTEGIAVDFMGNVWLGGGTDAPDFPIKASSAQRSVAGGRDAFMAALSTDLSTLLYSTYLGGGSGDAERSLAVDAQGAILCVGSSSSRDFPSNGPGQRTYGGGDSDGFITKVKASINSTSALRIVSAASYSTLIARDSIAAGFGEQFTSRTETSNVTPLPTSLAGVNVRILDSAGVEHQAPLFFASPTQVNYLVPPNVALGTASVMVNTAGGLVSQQGIEVQATAPGLFTANSNGQGVAAAVAVKVKSDGSQTSQLLFKCGSAPGTCTAAPVDLGSATDDVIVQLFGTGIRGRSSLSQVRATLDGINADVLYAGPQGQFSGLDQINVRIPKTLGSNRLVEIAVTVDGKPANRATMLLGSATLT